VEQKTDKAAAVEGIADKLRLLGVAAYTHMAVVEDNMAGKIDHHLHPEWAVVVVELPDMDNADSSHHHHHHRCRLLVKQQHPSFEDPWKDNKPAHAELVVVGY
jgi:predicted transcriptional regulator